MINKTVTCNYLNKERTIDNFILLINNCSMTENGVDIMSHIFQRKHLHNAITISTLNWSISSLDLHSSHNNDVIMNATASQPVIRLFTQLFIQSQIKENMKAPRYWPLWGEFTGDRWIPRTKGQQREKCFHLMTSSCKHAKWEQNMQIRPWCFRNQYVFLDQNCGQQHETHCTQYVPMFIPIFLCQTCQHQGSSLIGLWKICMKY